jgi:hypothetical protein
MIALKTRDGDFEYVVDMCFPFTYLGAAPDRFIMRAWETAGTR